MTRLVNPDRLNSFSLRPEVQRRLVQVYLDTTPGIVEATETAVIKGDAEEIAFNAHSLKGASQELGAEQLVELSHQLQLAARSGDSGAIPALSSQMASCHKETVTALNAFAPG